MDNSKSKRKLSLIGVVYVLLIGGGVIGGVLLGVELFNKFRLLPDKELVVFGRTLQLRFVYVGALPGALIGILAKVSIKKIVKERWIILLSFVVFCISTFLYKLYEIESLNMFFTVVICQIVFDRIYKYNITYKEIYFLHKLGKLKFNKEYFNLYNSRNGLIYSYFTFSFYVIFVICIKLEEKYKISETSISINKLFTKVLAITSLSILIWTFLLVIFSLYICGECQFIGRHNKKVTNLVNIKGDNFEPYTPREKAIILE